MYNNRKKVFMKIVSRLLSVILLISICFGSYGVKTVYAKRNNVVVLNANYLNKEKCWIEAGKYTNLGMSRGRIAVEIYAHALADNVSYRTLQNKIGQHSLLAQFVRTHAHEVNLGGDSAALVQLYYLMWQKVESSRNATYYIHSKLNTRQVIDVNGNSNRNGAKIQLYRQNWSSAQQFELFWTGNGYWYNLLKKGTFKVLDVTGGIARSQIKVQLFDYNGTKAQQWRMVSDGGGYYYLQNRLGYYLDAQGGNSSNGTQIWTYTWNRTNAQKWYLWHY